MVKNKQTAMTGFALLLASMVMALLFTGCPPNDKGPKNKINVDSVIKANKSRADSVNKLPPALPTNIPLDSLRKVLKVTDDVSDERMVTWMSAPALVPIPQEPQNCSLVVVVFTDTEVSQLYTRVSSENPSQLSILNGQMAAPIIGAQPYFLGPDVYTRDCNPNNTSSWVPYSLSSPQMIKWASTSPMVKGSFMQALGAFNTAAQVSGTRNVLWITNLGHGSLSTTPYTNVVYTVTHYNASTRIHVIQLVN